jgi:hypothetical protein
MASLALHPKTQDVTVEYVHGAGTDVDMLFSREEKRLKVHEKWLDFNEVHETAPCEVSRVATVRDSRLDTFACDHIVEGLHELAVDAIIETLDLGQSEANSLRRSLRHEVREKLRQMPRMITVACTERPHELAVSWTDGESELIRELYGSDITYYVVMHRETLCSQQRTDLLHQNGKYTYLSSLYMCVIAIEIGNESIITDAATDLGQSSDEVDEKLAPCGCQRVMISRTARRAVFNGLTSFESYFPMVARTESGSFFGLPPKAINPKPYPSRRNTDLLRNIPFDSTPQEYMYSSDEQGSQFSFLSDEDDDTDMLRDEVTDQEETQSRDTPAPRRVRRLTTTTVPVVGASATDPGRAQVLPDRTSNAG